jgi:hypothetical protein
MFFAAGDDHVIDSTGYEQVAIRVDEAGVASKIPTLAQRLGICFRSPPIALESLVTG